MLQHVKIFVACTKSCLKKCVYTFVLQAVLILNESMCWWIIFSPSLKNGYSCQENYIFFVYGQTLLEQMSWNLLKNKRNLLKHLEEGKFKHRKLQKHWFRFLLKNYSEKSFTQNHQISWESDTKSCF